MAAPVVLEWTLPIRCSREEAWAVFSDTDRFNRNFGLVISFREEVDEAGRPRRFGKMRRFGMTLEWEEQPFEYRAPTFFRQERCYTNSPLASLTVECDIEAAWDGVVVRYRLTLVPRNFILRAVVAAEARMTTRPQFERVFASMVDLLEGRENHYDRPAPEVSHPTLDALDDHGDIARSIAAHIRRAPLPSQARLRPLEFAHRLGTSDDATIRSFLQAVDIGALELWWELLCPSCQAPKEVRPTLDVIDADVHCSSCQIRYDASFPDSVDVVFRPRPEVREVDVPVACLLSPGRTPHVRMQHLAPPGETTTMVLELTGGGHRIDTDPRLGSASLEVRQGLPARITIDITERGIVPAILRVGPGDVAIVARNRTSRPVRLQVERAYRPPFALTAGRLFEVDGALDVLPAEAVSPDVEVTVRNGFAAAFREVAQNDGDTGQWDWDLEDEGETLTGNGTTLRVFGTEAALVAFLQTFSGRPGFAVGAARGPVATMANATMEIPTGSTVERAIHLMHTAGGDRVAIDGELAREMNAPAGVRLMWVHEDDFAYLCMPFDPSSEARDTSLPDTIADYVIQSELGRGAMGRVLAAQGPDGAAVVVKVLLSALSTDAEHSQRFFNEAHLTAGIRHPNIVSVLDWGRDPHGLYMVMERLHGRDLESRLRDGPLPEADVLDLAGQLLDGLQCAHDCGIVHRDIKPANLLIQDDGVLKILDFGIAHPPNVDDDLVDRGVILGTPRYMSPEQVARDPIDVRSDIYSAGLVLFECLTGDIPFSGTSARAIALARLGDEPESLDADGVSSRVEAAILRALSLDPARRFTSASEFAAALGA